MELPADLVEAVTPHLDGPILHATPLSGGCIARATRLETASHAFFLKYGRDEVALTFPAEALGLRALQEAGSPLLIPEVIAVGAEEAHHPGFLVMAWIETGSQREGFWEAFGHGLAAMHRHTARQYGFEENNYIGRLPQRNTWATSWPAFFRACRLEPQVQQARAAGRWQSGWQRGLERLYHRLEDLLPALPPASILHGDLWSGNVLAVQAGPAALIDPAAYYGHREADLAMTELFGGFSTRFYDAYHEAWPLEPGYEERRAIYNLYHLLNHLNHFGDSYAGSVAVVLKRFA